METLEAEFLGNESALDRISVEDLSNPNFDFSLYADAFGVTKEDIYNYESDLPF